MQSSAGLFPDQGGELLRSSPDIRGRVIGKKSSFPVNKKPEMGIFCEIFRNVLKKELISVTMNKLFLIDETETMQP